MTLAQILDITLVLVALGWAVWTMAHAFGLVGRKPKAQTCAHCPVRPPARPRRVAPASHGVAPVANWAKK